MPVMTTGKPPVTGTSTRLSRCRAHCTIYFRVGHNRSANEYTNRAIGQVILNGFTGTVQIGANLTCDTLTITTGTLQINSGVDLAVNNTTTINGGTLTLNDPGSQHSLGVFALSNGGTFNGPAGRCANSHQPRFQAGHSTATAEHIKQHLAESP
jgi:hypothetical protein